MVGIEYGNTIHFTQVMFSNKLHLSVFFFAYQFLQCTSAMSEAFKEETTEGSFTRCF